MKESKNALVVLAIDGISTIYSGVGTIVYSFFEAYDEIKRSFGEINVELFAFTPYFDMKDSRYSSRVSNDVKEICLRNGGELIYLPTMCHGEAHTNSWRGNKSVSITTQWESSAISAAASLNLLSMIGKYDNIFVLCHDSLFANVAKFILNDNVHLCWVPHSLSSIINDHIQSNKLEYETESINEHIKKGHKIAYISELTKQALLTTFSCKEEQLVSLYSGIFLKSKKFNISEKKSSIFNKYNIPQNKPLIFSWARCHYVKGIDTILRAFISYKNNISYNNADVHLILLCPDSSSINSYIEEINNLKGNLSSDDYTFINSFDEQLPLVVLKHDLTKGVILASRSEAFGLCSLEALAFRNPNVSIIYSRIPTFEEVLKGKNNTKSFSPEDYLELAKNINEITTEKKDSLSEVNSPNDKFDLVKNYSHGLFNFILNKPL